jgi:alkanesulfonate monooxygenase SsuD/methylene tetrahydromethanopterin reductase-like flavin-dependent oxidoreductase (luciferase family)
VDGELEIGVSLPIAGEDIPDVTQAARCAEELGLDSVWVGDHLSDGRPILEATVALAAAAAVTRRVRVGFGILQLALRHPAWAAKQIGSLQYLSDNRLILGVGVGGSAPQEWQAVGVPLEERGIRTDRALAVLGPLVAGKATDLPGAAGVTLAPAVPPPPVWIGGGSAAALRRAVRFGEAWLAAATPPDEIAEAAVRLRVLAAAADRSAPAVASVVIAAAGDGTGEGLTRFLSARLGMSPDRAARTAVFGDPAQLADQLRRYADAGVRHVVLAPFGADWRTQFELFAEARRRLCG